MKSLTLIAVLILLFATSNCALIGLEEEEEETETAETGSIDDLQGTWTMSCTEGTTESLVISGTNYTYTITTYWDENCINANFTTSDSLINLSPGVKTNLADGTEGYFLSGTYQSITVTPLDDFTAWALNNDSFCEINSWQTNVAYEISNKTCTDVVLPKLGTTMVGKYSITGNKLHLWLPPVSENHEGQTTVFTKQ